RRLHPVVDDVVGNGERVGKGDVTPCLGMLADERIRAAQILLRHVLRQLDAVVDVDVDRVPERGVYEEGIVRLGDAAWGDAPLLLVCHASPPSRGSLRLLERNRG